MQKFFVYFTLENTNIRKMIKVGPSCPNTKSLSISNSCKLTISTLEIHCNDDF